jgi:iron complex outermembrane receptor protein
MTIMNDQSLQTYNGGMSGSLFSLPGGKAGLAFGGEVRHEWRTSDFDHDANEDRYIFYVGNPDSSVARNVYSGYVELRLPFYRGLEVQGAARLEHYTDIDSTAVSPFGGLTFTPAQMFGADNIAPVLRTLQLRGNVSRAFRAPTIVQSDNSYQTVPYPLRLSAASPLSTYLPVRRYGNPNLKPETATTLSAGFTWSPIDVLAVSADYWHYDYINRIGVEDAQQIVNQDMLSPDSHVVRDANGSIVGVNLQQVNLKGHTLTSGLDFGLMLNLPGGENRPKDSWNVSVGALGTYTINYDIPRSAASPRSIPADPTKGAASKVLPPADCTGSATANVVSDGDVCHVAGKRNANNFAPPIPRWHVNVPITFSLAGHSVSAITHFISGMEDDVSPHLDGSFDWISTWLSLDLQYGYRIKDFIGDELAVRVGVYNIFDAAPPHVNGSAAGYEAAVHDPRGRMYYAKLSGRF